MAKRTIRSSTGNKATITISEAFESFIKEKRAKNLVEATIKNYQLTMTRFMESREFDNDTDIKVITKQVIIDWITDMQKKELRPQSINHFLRDIKSFLRWCMADDQKYLPPFKIDAVREDENLPKSFEQDEMKALLRKPKGKEDENFVEWRTWAMIVLSYDMGGRAGSVTEVRLEDINLAKNTIYLRHTKNRKLAVQKISTECAKALGEYIKLYRWGCDDEEYLFPNQFGDFLTYDGLRKALKGYCLNRGVEHYNYHGFRHSFAEQFVQNSNGDMVRLQKALGHSSIEMARKYVDMAAIDMGDYDTLSPLSSAIGTTKGAPKRRVSSSKRAS